MPRFFSGPGSDIHPRVREVMKALLEQNNLPVYLDPTAHEMLLSSPLNRPRTRACSQSVSSGRPGYDLVYLDGLANPAHPSGTRKTLRSTNYPRRRVALVFEKTPVARVQEIYRGFLANCPDAVTLARQFPYRVIEKYDRYLSDDLTAELFARERLDLSGALEKIRGIGPEGSALRQDTRIIMLATSLPMNVANHLVFQGQRRSLAAQLSLHNQLRVGSPGFNRRRRPDSNRNQLTTSVRRTHECNSSVASLGKSWLLAWRGRGGCEESSRFGQGLAQAPANWTWPRDRALVIDARDLREGFVPAGLDGASGARTGSERLAGHWAQDRFDVLALFLRRLAAELPLL